MRFYEIRTPLCKLLATGLVRVVGLTTGERRRERSKRKREDKDSELIICVCH